VVDNEHRSIVDEDKKIQTNEELKFIISYPQMNWQNVCSRYQNLITLYYGN
jgi:hypothetical protein